MAKNIDTTLTQAKDEREAMNFIWIGFSFFLFNHFKKTVLLILAVLIGLGMFFKDYFTSERINIMKDIKPMSSNEFKFNFPERLNAEIKDGKIIFEGQPYAYGDDRYIIHKIQDENAVLIYDKKLKFVAKAELPFHKLKD